MDATSSLLHWGYALVMGLSAVAFYVLSRNPKGVPQYKYLIHLFVVVWSGLAYAGLAMGQGIVEAHGREVYLPRYLDWVVTTPLLLLSLNLTGKYTIELEGSVTGGLLGSQVIMILTGMLAELSEGFARWFWYGSGCVALVGVLGLFWGKLYEKARSQGPEIERVYRSSALYLTVQWLLYPLVWAVGTPALGLLDKLTTSVLLIILPLISKAGFGFFNLLKLRGLPPEHHPRP